MQSQQGSTAILARTLVLLACSPILSTTAQETAGSAAIPTGTVIIEAIIEPATSADSLTFEGTPSGVLVVDPNQQNRLAVEGLSAGSYTSALTEIGPHLSAQGYAVDRIRCDDDNSTGDVSSRTANFNLEEGETVVCQFRLAASTCVCPRAGSWTGSNLPGLMVCTGTMERTLPLIASRQRGTLRVSDGCQTLIATKMSDEYSDVIMKRGPDCGYEGSAQSTPMEIFFTWDVQNEEYITGSLHSEFAQQGATCTMSRDLELRFNE